MSDWSRHLRAFAARIEAVERGAATGEWDDLLPWSPPSPPAARPTADDAERFATLLARAQAAGDAITRLMAANTRELANGRRLRTAVRRYAAMRTGGDDPSP